MCQKASCQKGFTELEKSLWKRDSGRGDEELTAQEQTWKDEQEAAHRFAQEQEEKRLEEAAPLSALAPQAEADGNAPPGEEKHDPRGAGRAKCESRGKRLSLV